MDSQDPPEDQLTSPPNPPDEVGGAAEGDAGGESSAAAPPEVLPEKAAEDDGMGQGPEPEATLDSPVADVAAGDCGAPEIKADEKEKIKRKRGRAARASSEKAKSVVNPPRKREKKDEEEVCFICFDGGELVVCDRRCCPKAYHPACIKRSQSFFRSKARWNCGWHICTSCQKTAHYMCYTCPHSLCKTCYRNSDFVCIREAKGLCVTCMGTIMLIENVKEANKEMVVVDFDDKTSWEYLFKVYWTDLKEKLSLTVDEITRAKYLHKERKSKRRRSIEKSSSGYAKLDTGKIGSQKSLDFLESRGWASNELLEFIGYMKGGDISALTRFEVQALLLEYVNRNNLRDSREKWEISCDVRLRKLFGKASVDHFEMLKLLDSHFHVKEVPQLDGVVRGTNFDAVGGQRDIDLNRAEQPVVGGDKKHETHEKLDVKDSHSNRDDHLAMDSQTISSLYLPRNLIEKMIGDVEQFQEKVVGSIVRIRISGKDQKQETYRLVQVTGTCKATELYKIGDKYTNVKIEILNLDRKEVISIDEISDHDFIEEEVRQFNQSIRCGIVKWFRKDEIQLKSVSVKAEQVNDESSYQPSVTVNKSILGQGGETSRINSWSTGKSHADAISSVTREALSGTASEISPSPLSTATEQSVNDDETCKIWQYQDSHGKIQGPFTTVQMRKWRTLGHFPHGQRIWRVDEKQEDSVLLTHALDAHFHKESPAPHSKEEVRHIPDDRDSSLDGVSSISVNTNNKGTRSHLGSHSSSHTIKTERENNEKALLGPTNPSQGFCWSKGISSLLKTGSSQSQAPDGSTNGDGYSSTQSSGQNWMAPSPVVSSSNEHPIAGSLVNLLLSTPQHGKGIEIPLPAPACSAQNLNSSDLRSPNVRVDDSGPVNRVVTSEWGSNLVDGGVSASQKPTEMSIIDGSTLTLGSAQLMPSPLIAPTNSFSWQAMVLESDEFTPLPEEQVSDLIAELEASEPLNTIVPSPSPKGPDGSRGFIGNDFFSHEPSFFSVPQLGRLDPLSSSPNFPNMSLPAVGNEPHGSGYFNPPLQNTQRNGYSELGHRNGYSEHAVGNEPQGSCYFNPPPPHNTQRNGYSEHGQVSWVGNNPAIWEKQQHQQHQQQQQQNNPYYVGNINSNPRDQFFDGLNLDLGRGRSIWDRQ